ncbi:hypothetical protein KC711_00820 [Candidatus Peregrinibacteria bacterium]|nr:hypothetical protein [Candidatus Peregrinibacteria bacterium]MCB9804754.1 hypothetical protein [Candidatus Peribacteria bacterium]
MYEHKEGDYCLKSTLILSDTETLLDTISEFQHIQVIHHHDWGNVLLLDGVIQLCDAYEWSYHEMMVHVAMQTHQNPKRALILGGGDGGCLRELLRYESIEEVVTCDIDPVVTEVARKYFPQVASGFDNARSTLVHQDGAVFVKEYDGAPFDIVLIDSTDETEDTELGGQLHGEAIFADIKKITHPDALIVSYGDSPFSRFEFYQKQYSMLQKNFASVDRYLAFVPMYQSGCFGFFISSELAEISRAFHDHSGNFDDLKYYTHEIHQSCFVLPRFLH